MFLFFGWILLYRGKNDVAFYPVSSVATKRDNLQFIPLLHSGITIGDCVLLKTAHYCCVLEDLKTIAGGDGI